MSLWHIHILFFSATNDPEFNNKIKAQALLYLGLHIVDFFMPSHQEYEHGLVLSREMAIKIEYPKQ